MRAGLMKALAEHVAGRYGMASEGELRLLGISIVQRRQLVTEGLLIRQHRGVYRFAAVPESFEGRCLAACLAVAEGVITGRAAARLWQLRCGGPVDQIEMRVPHFVKARFDPGVLFRRCNVLDPVDVVVRRDGIRVVSPPRVLFDMSALVDDLDLESMIEQVLDRKSCTINTLFSTGRRLGRSARPGSARFARVLASRPAWIAPVDSDLEMRLYDGLRSAGVAGMDRQYKIELPAGWSIHADVAVPELRWAIPIDHVTWHGGRINAQRDKQNDRQVRMIGWQVDRVTDEDINHCLPVVVAELLAIYANLRARQDGLVG